MFTFVYSEKGKTTMDHTKALDFILSNACGVYTDKEVEANEGYQRFHIETHCKDFIVEAKLVSKQGEPFKWSVRSCTL